MKKLSFLALALCFLFATSCSDDNVNNTEGEFTTKILFYSNYGEVKLPITKVDVYYGHLVNLACIGSITKSWVDTENEPDCDKFYQDNEEVDKQYVVRFKPHLTTQNNKIRYYAKIQLDNNESYIAWKEVEMELKPDTCYKIFLDVYNMLAK